MKWESKHIPNPNVQLYGESDIDIAYRFSKTAFTEFGSFIKAIVLFGGAARRKTDRTDIDILIIVDDISISISDEMVAAYRLICEKIVLDTNSKLHITTLKLTNFWEYCRNGDPIVINILRDGIALLDTGFFEPMQGLLMRGRIRPSQESIWAYYSRAPMALNNSKWHLSQATLDLYWAVIDSAHAVLMSYGHIPPTPEHVGDMLDEKLVSQKLLERKYVDIMRNFYSISKKILRREIGDIEPLAYRRYLADAEDFVEAMSRLLKIRVGDAPFRSKSEPAPRVDHNFVPSAKVHSAPKVQSK